MSTRQLIGNIKGSKGDRGVTFTPSVSADGDLSWSNDGGLPNPETRNLKGVSITNVTQTVTSSESGGVNTITVTLSDGTSRSLNVANGARGETGEPFRIAKTYASVAAMNADAASVASGAFVVIASDTEDPDNAKLYVRSESGFTFITDLSGARGIQGPAGVDGVSVSTVTHTTDANGNVVVTLTLSNGNSSTFTIPKGTQGIQGPAGTDGVSILSVADATDSNGNVVVTVTLSNGNASTFTIPKGQQGETGTFSAEDLQRITALEALTFTDFAAASPVGEQHRMIFGGRNLGTSVSSAQIAAVRNGSFSGLLVGDYWVINNVTWRIVDMDYWYACGDTAFNRHHLVIMPDSNLTTATMNDTNTTEGGYTGSKMYTDTLPAVKTTCAAAFPSMVLTHRDFLVTAVTNGRPSSGTWMDSDVELPSEIMMYGNRILSPGNDGPTASPLYTISKSQLALFSLAPRFIKASSGWSWLRDPVSATDFAGMNSHGRAGNTAASYDGGGIRPVFAVG